jgi:type IV secretion system protein VirD4
LVANSRSDSNLIVHDPKGELYKIVSGLLKQNGFTVWALNTRCPLQSDCWSLFEYCHDLYNSGDAMKICRAREIMHSIAEIIIPVLSKDPFWELASRAVIEGVAERLIRLRDDPSEISFSAILEEIEALTESAQSRYEFNSEDCGEGQDHLKIAPTVNASDVTQRSIIGTVGNYLMQYVSSPLIEHIFSNKGISFERLLEGKVAIFLITPDENATYNPLISIFVKMVYEYLSQSAYELGGALPHKTYFVLDEFGMMTRIPSMSHMMSAARSRGMFFLLSVQALDQLKSTYGDDAETIKSNCSIWIFFRSRSISTLSEISALCGEDGLGIRHFSIEDLQYLNNRRGDVLILRPDVRPYIGCLRDFTVLPYFNDLPEEHHVATIDPSTIMRPKKEKTERGDLKHFSIMSEFSSVLSTMGHGSGVSAEMEGSCEHLMDLIQISNAVELYTIITTIVDGKSPKAVFKEVRRTYDETNIDYTRFRQIYEEIRSSFKFLKSDF